MIKIITHNTGNIMSSQSDKNIPVLKSGSLLDPRLGSVSNYNMYSTRCLAFPIKGECPIKRVKRTLHETYYSIHYERMSKGLNDYYVWEETPIYKELTEELSELLKAQAKLKIQNWVISICCKYKDIG